MLKDSFKQYIKRNKHLKRGLGIFFVVVGVIALLTPFTPGSWLIFVGFELLGIRVLLADKLLARFRKKD